MRRLVASVLLLWTASACRADDVHFELGKSGLDPDELAVIVNTEDPMSEAISVYYQQHRGIPDANIVRVHFPANGSVLPKAEFARVKAEVDQKTPAGVQAFALAWTKPYRVDCMSITTAFALGFDPAYCSSHCSATTPSPYFHSASRLPYADLRIRPAMMLAGTSFQQVKALILRGIAADYTYPGGTGYLLHTSDASRRVRSVFFDEMLRLFGDALHLQRVNADSIRGKKDVLFYFTGLIKVPDLPTLRFLPGAIADHLTSAGGQLTDSGQMSSLRWLEAGATGSYGTVVEPCNHLQKFPHPGVVIEHYAAGETLIEAYWKSVAWPGEGVFIGEPLAKPFAPKLKRVTAGTAEATVFSPQWRNLRLEAAPSGVGPFVPVEPIPVKPGRNELKIPLPDAALVYRIGF